MSKLVLQILHAPRTLFGEQPHNQTSSSVSINIPSPRKQKLQLLTASFTPSKDGLNESIEPEFGQLVARHTQLHQEYWTAACLRAETHWEGREHDRYVESYKRKFAEQEFNEMKRRYNSQLGERCKCIVMVTKEDVNKNRNVLKSVVGTLDLSVQYFSHGPKFPGDLFKPLNFCIADEKSSGRYGYITNLCVAKSLRRKGVASSMLNFAFASAKAQGADKVFVHVHKDNIYAQSLYQKLGFQVVEAPTSQFSNGQTYLLCHHPSE